MKTRTLSAALAGIISFLAAAVSAQVTVTTVAIKYPNLPNDPGLSLNEPYGVVLDALGNFYVSDGADNRIVRVDASTQVATTLAGIPGDPAGSNDGPPDQAHFNSPQGLLTVSIGGVGGLLVADSGNNLIRFVRFSDGVVTTLAGQINSGPAVNAAGTNATFHYPIGLDQDTNGNVYIADWGNDTIRVLNLNDPAFGITNVLISGTSFHRPTAVAFAGTNQLWVADTGNQMIKLVTLVTPASGSLTTYVGGYRLTGTTDASFGPNARFNTPSGLLWLSGVGLLISDTVNNSIRLATNNPAYGATNYSVKTFAGTPGAGNGGLQDGSDATAKFNTPFGLAQDIVYNAFLVADVKNNAIRRIQNGPPRPATPTILTVLANYGQVSLTWSTSAAATSYNVKRSTSSGGPYPTIASPSSTNYTDSSVINGTTYYYVVSAVGAGGESPNSAPVSATPPLPPVPAPKIGYVDFPATANPPYSSVLHPVSSFFLNNDAFIVIEGTPGSQTFYTYGPTSGSIPDPTSASASAPVGYQDGFFPTEVAFYSVAQILPDLTIKAIGEKPDGSPNSAVVQTRFQFITANPNINGNNSAQFTVSELTTNAEMWYTIDGTDPTNAAPSFGPITTNSATLSFNASTALTFKIRAFRNNYQPSAIVTTTLQPSRLSALFNGPRGLALNTVGSLLYIADQTNNAIQALNLANNLTTTFLNTNNGISRPVDVAVDSSDNLYVLNQSTPGNGYILEFDRFGNLLATNAAKLALPTALKLDGYGSLFVAEQGGTIQQFTSAGVSNSLVTITSGGVELEGLALFDDGTIAVSDAGNHVIWQVHPVTRAVSLLTGSIGVPGSTLGAASFAKLNQPQQLARAAGNLLVAADYGNNRLVVIDRSGAVTNVLNSTNALVWYGRSGDPHGNSDSHFTPMMSPVGVVLSGAGEVFSSEGVFNDVRQLLNSGLASTPTPNFPSPTISGPRGIALNSAGGLLYIANLTNNTIQAINLANNLTTNFLNANNGISRPVDVAVDSSDNLYVLNQSTPGNGYILEFDRFGNVLATNAAQLAMPTALKLDGYGSLFVTEQGGTIQQFTSSGAAKSIATITSAGVELQGLALFDDGTIAVSDAGNHVIWQVNPVTRTVSLLTGAVGVQGSTLGGASLARLNQPQQLARAAGNLLVAADYGNNRLVVIDRSGAVTNVLNSTNALVWYGRSGDPHGNSDSLFAPMMSPVGVALNSAGEVFSSEALYNDVRQLLDSGLASTPTPNFPSPAYSGPRGIALNSGGGLLYIANQTNNTIQAINLANNLTTNLLDANNGISRPVDVAVDLSDNLYVLNQGTGGNGSLMEFDQFGNLIATIASNLAIPTALKLDAYGSVFVAEQGGAIQQFSGGISNLIATVPGTGVELQGIALFDDGTIAVSDGGNHVIWQANPVTRAVSLLTGAVGVPGSTLGAASFARLNQPQQLARAAGNLLVAADYGNNRLVVIDRSGAVTNVLNSTNALVWYGRTGDPHGNSDPQFAPMVAPVGVALNSAGEVFSSEGVYNDIRKLLNTGLASTPTPYFRSPLFNGPKGLALNTSGGLLYIADQTSNTVKVLNLANNITTVFLSASNGISQPVDVAVDFADYLYVLNQGTGGNGSLMKFDHFGNPLGTLATNLVMPTALRNTYGGLLVTEEGGAIQQFISGTSNTIVTIANAGVQLQGINLFNDGTIVVSDAGNHVIWQVNPVTKAVTLLTGALGIPGNTLGATNFARLNQPHQLARALGDLLVVADYGNNRLVVVDRSGSVTNILNSTNALVWYGRSGDPHGPADPQFEPMLAPVGVVLSSGGEVFASEASNNGIRKLLGTGLAGPPPSYFPPSLFNGPRGLALNSAGSLLYIADQTNNAIQALNLADNLTTAFLSAGDGVSRPVDVAVDYSDKLYVLNQGTNGNGSIQEFDRFGNFLGAIATNLAKPTAFTLKGSTDFFVVEQDGAIQQFSPGSSNTLATITTPGVRLQGIALFDDGTIAVSDSGNHVIWQVSPVTNAISLLTGSVGLPGSTLGGTNFARLNQPQQLARAVGNLLVAADYGNNRLVVIDRSGSITKVLDSTNALVWYGRAGDPHASSDPQFAPMALPTGLALNNAGDVFASEALYDDIRKLAGTGLTAPPGTPTILTVVTNYGQVQLTWSASANATGYNVKRSPSSLGPYTTIASTASTNYTDTSVLNGATYYYVVSGTGGGSESPNSDPVRVRTPLPPVPDPVIGWVDFPQPYYLSVLHPVSSFILNNDASIVIKEDAGCQLYYTYGPTDDSIPDPTSASASVPAGYQDGLASSDTAAYFINVTLPDLTIKAIGEKADGSPNSAIVQARFQFIAANPVIAGLNFHNFTVGEITTNADLFYTLDGTDPSYTNGFELSTTAAQATPNLWVVQFNSPIESNILFRVRAFRNNYQRSAIMSQWFYPSNAIANRITPNSGYYPMGQTITVVSSNSNVYYTGDGSEPTTDSLPVFITNHVGYIRWFNSTNDLTGLRVKVLATGGGEELTGQPVAINTIGVPPDANPAIYAGIGAQIVVPVVVNLRSNVTIQSCQFRVELSPNASAQPVSSGGFELLNLGAGPSDFIPLRWPVLSGSAGSITTSNYTVGSTSGMEIAALGPNAMSLQNFAVVALLRIAIPYGAGVGDSYALVVRYPSATADGLSDFVPLTPMAPATILVTNVAYTVGDSASLSGGWSVSGGWYNAGGFGDGDLDNSDVNLGFGAAVGLRVPYSFSDVFNAMDAYPVDAPGYVGGDGQIRFLDWNVILQRALRLDTNNWARAWSAGGNLVDFSTTLTASDAMPKDLQPKSPPPWPWYRQALIGAVSTGNAVPGRTVNVPVYVKLSDGAALSGVQFRAVVTPQGEAPPLTQAPQLSLASGVPGPTLQQSFKASDAGFGWALGSFNYLSRSSNFLGWVTFTIPATAQSGQTYSVSFANADGAPNLSVQYDFETRSAWVTVGGSAPPASICSDEWKIHFFGSLTNPSAGDLADADGDGVPNWVEYLAGTDPADPKSRLQLSGSVTQAGKAQPQMAIHWLTAPGKAYEVQWSSGLSGDSWSTLVAVSGDGTVASCSDTNLTAAVRYYRLRVLP